jgi:hypothetical protein
MQASPFGVLGLQPLSNVCVAALYAVTDCSVNRECSDGVSGYVWCSEVRLTVRHWQCIQGIIATGCNSHVSKPHCNPIVPFNTH